MCKLIYKYIHVYALSYKLPENDDSILMIYIQT